MLKQFRNSKLCLTLEQFNKPLFFSFLIVIIGLVNWLLQNSISAKRLTLVLFGILILSWCLSQFKLNGKIIFPLLGLVLLTVNLILFSIFYTKLSTFYVFSVFLVSLFQSILAIGLIIIFKSDRLLKYETQAKKTRKKVRNRVRTKIKN